MQRLVCTNLTALKFHRSHARVGHAAFGPKAVRGDCVTIPMQPWRKEEAKKRPAPQHHAPQALIPNPTRGIYWRYGEGGNFRFLGSQSLLVKTRGKVTEGAKKNNNLVCSKFAEKKLR